MELNDFILKLADQFDDTDVSELTPDCVFQELEEWSSLTALGIIAMAKMEYNKTINGREVRSCQTVKDLFDLVEGK